MAFSFKPETEDWQSTWKWLHQHAQQDIETALLADPTVKAGLDNLKNNPTDDTTRSNLVGVVARQTGNCVGQVALHHHHLATTDGSQSAYRAFPHGTAEDIAKAVSSDSKVKTDPVSDFLRMSVRYTGNCLGQAAVQEGKIAVGEFEKILRWIIAHIP